MLPAKWLFNLRLVAILTASVILLGLMSMFALPRRLNPQIKIPIVIVSTVLPGASPADVETLVTKPLEDELIGLDQLDVVTSSSQDNLSVITLQFYSTKDGDRANTDVQRAVQNVTLPANALTPKATLLDFENQPVWTFAVTSNGDTGTLMRFSTRLKDEIKKLPQVKDVDLGGFDTQEVSVVVDPQKAAAYGLSPFLLSQTIQKSANSFPAGTLDTGNNSFALTVDPQITTVDSLRDIVISSSGQNVRLGDLAQISVRPGKGITRSYVAGKNLAPRQAVTFYVYKTTTANIDQTASIVKKTVDESVKTQGDRFKITSEVNAGEQIQKQYVELFGDFVSTLALVFLDLFLFLGFRQAALATFATPLTFLSGLIIMNIFGLSINFISLFAFLLALGTSIDDTIVIVSAVTTYQRTKKFSPRETSLLVWRDFIVPIWSTTITTVWAYVPLLISTGIIGEFIKPIPIVVAATMYSSTFFAVMVTLPLLIVVLKPRLPKRIIIFAKAAGIIGLNILLVVVLPKTILIPLNLLLINLVLLLIFRERFQLLNYGKRFLRQNRKFRQIFDKTVDYARHGIINTKSLRLAYQKTIFGILESKHGIRDTLIIVVAFAIFAYTLVPLGLVKNEFFPKSDADTLYVVLEMPGGTNLQTVEDQALIIGQNLRKLQDAASVVIDPGKSFNGMGFAGSKNSALLTVNLLPKGKRKQSSITIAEKIRQDYKNYAFGTLTVREQSGGPPAGSDIQIKFTGNDLGVLDKYADKTINFLKNLKGVTDVAKSVKPGISKITFVPDQEKLVEHGITLDQVGLTLRSYASGFNLDKIRFNENGNDKTEVNFRYLSQNPTPEEMGTLSIMTQTGLTPLTNLGRFTLENNPTVITHEAGKRVISVSAGVAAGYVTTEINKQLTGFAAGDLKLPSGYDWKTGGVNEENAKSVQSIFRAMILSFILILVTMVVQFRSFRQAMIVLLLIPLAISGVFVIFGLTATPLSFPALIGVLALFGVVVTNAMFIVDKINRNLVFGMPLKNAIADAGESRLEPIMLTSLTTILGLIPISISNPIWRGLGGSIIAGLTFSGVIMLFFVPVMYYLLYRGTRD